MTIAPDIEITQDGSTTLMHPVFRQTYHSTRGAVGESEHVFINNGLATLDSGKSHIAVFEMGLGSGLNAWLTLDYARRHGLTVDYRAVELYPISTATADALGYTDDPLFMALHTAEWDTPVQLTPQFRLTKIEDDLAETDFCTTFDIIYFDAFDPDCQPELWSPEVFATLYDRLDRGGVLVTYSAKGSVKKALRNAGFEVKRLPGALGKRHMLRAVKH